MQKQPPPLQPPSKQQKPRRLNRAQTVQENLYTYPYHYIPTWNGKAFSQTLSLFWGYEYLSYLLFVAEQLEQQEFSSLLDVGCGDGRFLNQIRNSHPAKRLTGIDYSARAIRLAQAFGPNLEWVRGDITKKNHLPDQFDVITLIETLEHIPLKEIDAFVEGLHWHLNTGGSLIITVPSNNTPVSAHHIQHFDLAGLTSLLGDKFKIVSVSYLNHNSKLLRKISRSVLHNALFTITHPRLLAALFRSYQKRFSKVDSQNCRRIFLHCRKK